MAKKTGVYDGVEFYVDDRWQFVVPDLGKPYGSYAEMTAAITASRKSIESANRVKLELPVFTEDGENTTITGIHAGHGTLTTKPSIGGAHCYVDVPWLREALKRRDELDLQSRAHTEVLERFEIATTQTDRHRYRTGHRGDGSPESLEKLHAKLVAKASTTTLEAELQTAKRKKIRF